MSIYGLLFIFSHSISEAYLSTPNNWPSSQKLPSRSRHVYPSNVGPWHSSACLWLCQQTQPIHITSSSGPVTYQQGRGYAMASQITRLMHEFGLRIIQQANRKYKAKASPRAKFLGVGRVDSGHIIRISGRLSLQSHCFQPEPMFILNVLIVQHRTYEAGRKASVCYLVLQEWVQVRNRNDYRYSVLAYY